MPRLGPSSPARPFSAMFAHGIICAALISVHGVALAQGNPGGGTGDKDAQDAKEQKARELFESIEWGEGPGWVPLGELARLKVSRGYVFTDPKGAATFLEASESAVSDGVLGILAPESFDWYIVFEPRPGIKGTDGKGKIDADALFQSLRREEEKLNAIHRAHGWDDFKLLGWDTPPAYEGSRHDLTWAMKYESGGEQGISYVTRIFGRTGGAIDAYLNVSPEDAARVRPIFRNIMSLVEFNDEPQAEQKDEAGEWVTAWNKVTDPYGRNAGKLTVRKMRLVGAILFGVISGVIAVIRKVRSS